MDEQYNTPHQQHTHESPGPGPGPGPGMGMGPGMGPTGMPVRPYYYAPETFNKLFMWWWILLAAGIVTAVIAIGVFALIASLVLCCILFYKSWNQIQDGYQKTTPGKAVGFMFIPFFNFYWRFVNVHGLAQNLNAYGKRHGISFPRVNEGLALTHSILMICWIIPLLNYIAIIANLVIFIILLNQLKSASVAIAAHRQGGVVA